MWPLTFLVGKTALRTLVLQRKRGTEKIFCVGKIFKVFARKGVVRFERFGAYFGCGKKDEGMRDKASQDGKPYTYFGRKQGPLLLDKGHE